jgi:omega-6 fatty acid desaturase (delta-12 desaturase)
MKNQKQATLEPGTIPPARDLLKVLAPYRQPSHLRSVVELIITGSAFVGLWLAAWWALSISYWLTLAISVPAAAFLVRLFLIKHDCGHGAFFRSKSVNDGVGRVLGVLTLTPYDLWRKAHAVHHATSGNLSKRGVGDIDVMTVSEYRALPRLKRLVYRLYRNPLIMFGVGPAYHFLLRNRLPLGLRAAGWRYWLSAMGTNATIAIGGGIMIYFLGAAPFLTVHLPIAVLAGAIGIWLFYVQHQFEDTYWAEEENWNMQEAALQGSSHYDLPRVISWITAHIGVHHIHHLSSRIPFYRLPQVMRDFPELAEIRRVTFLQSLVCLRLRLWDEGQQKLVSFAEARAL